MCFIVCATVDGQCLEYLGYITLVVKQMSPIMQMQRDLLKVINIASVRKKHIDLALNFKQFFSVKIIC